MQKVLAIVLAGGEGARLQPLTADRCKPAVPFHGRHLIVDFVLSNLVNSQLSSIYVLVQYMSHPLIEHVEHSWAMAPFIADHFITVVPPQMQGWANRFRGTADAVFQNIKLIEAMQPDLVAVFAADHVYRMDVRQMIDAHRAAGAQVSVATLPVALHQCHHFGIVETDAQCRITGFREKPQSAPPGRGSRTHALASMGNYVFNADVLVQQLHRMHEIGGTDFGQDVLPAMLNTHKVLAYDFTANLVPGMEPYEEPAYWRDVGTIDAYFEAQFDSVGPRPKLNMTNRHWPIYGSAELPGSAQIGGDVISHSVLGSGTTVVDGATLDRAILRRSVRVEPAAELEHCIVMERSRIGRGAQVRHAIIDRDNDVPPGERIGMDPAQDCRRFTVTVSGITVVPAGYFPARSGAAVTDACG